MSYISTYSFVLYIRGGQNLSLQITCREVIHWKHSNLKYFSMYFIMRNLVTCMLHQILLGWSNQGKWDGRGI